MARVQASEARRAQVLAAMRRFPTKQWIALDIAVAAGIDPRSAGPTLNGLMRRGDVVRTDDKARRLFTWALA